MSLSEPAAFNFIFSSASSLVSSSAFGRNSCSGGSSKTNRYRQSGHLAKDADEIATLQWQQLLECFLARANTFRENHLAHCGESLVTEEHVLRTTESDSFGAKLRAPSSRRAACRRLLGRADAETDRPTSLACKNRCPSVG